MCVRVLCVFGVCSRVVVFLVQSVYDLSLPPYTERPLPLFLDDHQFSITVDSREDC